MSEKQNQEVLASKFSELVEDFAKSHSAALVFLLAEDNVAVGSATCVQIGEQFLLATAGHNFRGVANAKQIRVTPPNQGREDWLPIEAMNFVDAAGPSAIDLGWLQLPALAAKEAGLKAVPLTNVTPYERPSSKSLYHAQGLPAAHARFQREPGLTTISLASVGYLTPPIDDAAEDPSVDLALEYGDTAVSSTTGGDVELLHPAGMSGGGIWSVANKPYDGVWVASRIQLVGVIRSYDRQRRRLTGVQIQHWLQLVASDLPDLALLIQGHLVEASPSHSSQRAN